MGTNYTITVNNGSVSPETLMLIGPGSRTITWVLGSGVSKFKITGLDASVFSPSSSATPENTEGFVTSFQTTDQNGSASICDYNVETEDTPTWDPRIENDAVGTDPPDSP